MFASGVRLIHVTCAHPDTRPQHQVRRLLQRQLLYSGETISSGESDSRVRWVSPTLRHFQQSSYRSTLYSLLLTLVTYFFWLWEQTWLNGELSQLLRSILYILSSFVIQHLRLHNTFIALFFMCRFVLKRHILTETIRCLFLIKYTNSYQFRRYKSDNLSSSPIVTSSFPRRRTDCLFTGCGQTYKLLRLSW